MASSISLSPKVIGGGAFVSPFEWNENESIVIIKYKHGGGHIRAHPHNHELCDHKGGQTEWAKWRVHLSDSKRIAQLEHVKTGKYLEMDKNLSCINVASEGGSTSRWIVHPVSGNCVRLESERNKGYFLGVKPHDGVTVVNGKNLQSNSYQFQFTYLYFFIEGQKDEGYFKKPYLMKQQNTIIIKHPLNASLRTNLNDERELDINGQKEMNARWESIVTFLDGPNSNSTNTNNNNNNSNNINTSTSPSSSSSSSSSGSASISSNTSTPSEVRINRALRQKSNSSSKNRSSLIETVSDISATTSNNSSNDINSNSRNSAVVVVKELDKDNKNELKQNSDSVNNKNNNNNSNDSTSDNKDSNENEKNRKLNSDSKDDDSDEFDDSHEKTNIILQFRSVKSGGFIKLNDNKVTMSRKGDDFTKFRVYIVEQPNIVKLESTQHLGCYLRVTEKKGIHVGKGGPHCQMTLLRME